MRWLSVRAVAAVVVGRTFSGGLAEFTGSADITASASGSEIVTTSGALFGLAGDEIAGIIIEDDSGDGLTITGGFTAG